MGGFTDFLITFGHEANDIFKSVKRNINSDSYHLPNEPAVTVEEFSAMLQKYQKYTITECVPILQKWVCDETEFKFQLEFSAERINTILSKEILEEIQRLGKSSIYEQVISDGHDFSDRLDFWNYYIPNLKVFLDDSFNKVSRQIIFDLNFKLKNSARKV